MDTEYYVCIFCGANARTKEGLRIHTSIYHGQHEVISLSEINLYVDEQIEKMKILEKQGLYDSRRIVEDDPAVIEKMGKAVDKNNMVTTTDLITIDEFAKAIQNSINIGYNDAFDIAEHLLNFFGFEEGIIENYFDNDERQVLYQLEEYGLVKFKTDEYYVLDKSNPWITHQIILDYLKIHEMAKAQAEEKEEDPEELYEKLPEEAWVR